MKTHTIPEKVRAKVDRMYSGPDHERIIKALESGKTIYHGRLKFQGVKVKVKAAETVPPTAPPADSRMNDKPGKDKDKDKDR